MKFLGQDIGFASFMPRSSLVGPHGQSPEYLELCQINDAVRDIASNAAEHPPGPYEIASYDGEALSAQFEALQESNNALLEQQSIAEDNARQSRREQTWVLEDIRDAQGQHIAITSMMLRSMENSEASLDVMADTLDEIDRGLAKLATQLNGAAAAFMAEQARIATENNRLADLRHAELIDVLRQPAQTAADEKYAYGLAQFEAGHLALAAKDLRCALGHVSVHVPSLLLLGRVCVERGLAREAKSLFRRAATHAAQRNNLDAYVAAMIRLSHVERVVGNLESAHKIMVEAQKFLAARDNDPVEVADEDDWDDDADGDDEYVTDAQLQSNRRHRLVDYEELKARWAIPANQCDEVARDVTWVLRRLFGENTSLRGEVARLPLFANLRERCPWLKYRADDGWVLQDEAIGLLLALSSAKRYPKEHSKEHIVTVFARVLRRMRDIIADVRSGRIPPDAMSKELLVDFTAIEMCIELHGREDDDDLVVAFAFAVGTITPVVRFLELKVSLHDLLLRHAAYRKGLRWKEAEPIRAGLDRIKQAMHGEQRRRLERETDGRSALFAPYHAALAARAEEERVRAAQAAEEARAVAEKRAEAERQRVAREAAAAKAAEAARRQAEYEARWGPGEAGREAERAHLAEEERLRLLREAAAREAAAAERKRAVEKRIQQQREEEERIAADERMWKDVGIAVLKVIGVLCIAIFVATVLPIIAFMVLSLLFS